MTDDSEMVGAALYIHRVLHEVSQRDAAEWWGVTEVSWWRWENGRVPVPKWLRLSIRRGHGPMQG